MPQFGQGLKGEIMDRLDKMIAERAPAARSDARELIRSGRVSVNGTIERSPAAKPPEGAEIRLDGKVLGAGGYRYIMLNKPDGVVSSTKDRDKTVLSLLPEDVARGLFPVGRLDKDVTGLLILTDDGDFCHRATSPRCHVTKLYEAVASAPLDEPDVSAFAAGMTLGDGTKCRPAVLTIDPSDSRRCTVELDQGMYHQVKRMFAAIGKPLEKLHRRAVGALELDPDLAPGQWKILSEEEMINVFQQNTTNRKQRL